MTWPWTNSTTLDARFDNIDIDTAALPGPSAFAPSVAPLAQADDTGATKRLLAPLQQTSVQTRTVTYGYDGLNRLTGAQESGATTNNYAYSYDLAGNRTDGGRTYNAANQVTNSGWSYDAAGNLLGDGTTSYTYDAMSRVSTYTAGGQARTNAYNGDGTLVAQTLGGTTTRYVQDLAAPLTQMLNSGGTNYVYGMERLYASTSGTKTWYQGDALGSVRETLDNAGVVQSTINYDPWGQVQSGTVPTFGFTGEQQDGSLVNLRARWYNSSRGAFTTYRWRTDESDDLTPYSHHPYAYALGNPVLYTDPTGKCVPGIDRDCDWIWNTGQGINRADFETYWSTIGNTVKDTVVGPVQMLYNVATQEDARAQLARGGQAIVTDPIGSARTIAEMAATPFTDIYHGIACGDSTQLGKGLTEYAIILGGARLARGYGDNPSYFRGTSEGYPGNPGLQRIGVTPASTDPVVATIYATEGQNFGSGVVHIATSADLKGITIGEGNVLQSLEAEVGVQAAPVEFAARSSITITAAQARAILQRMGISVPSLVDGPMDVSAALKNTPRLTPQQIY